MINKMMLVLAVCALVAVSLTPAQQTILVDLHRGRTAPCPGASGDSFLIKGARQVWVDWGTVTPKDDAFAGLVLLSGSFGPRVGTCLIFHATGYEPAK